MWNPRLSKWLPATLLRLLQHPNTSLEPGKGGVWVPSASGLKSQFSVVSGQQLLIIVCRFSTFLGCPFPNLLAKNKRLFLCILFIFCISGYYKLPQHAA